MAQDIFDNTTTHMDDYLTANRRNQNTLLQDYDNQIANFKTFYLERVNIVNIQLNFLMDSLKEVDETLYTMELLGNWNKECITKYKSALPEEVATRVMMNVCVTTANSFLPSLTKDLQETRQDLKKYFENNFEENVANCNNEACVSNVVSQTNMVMTESRRTFNKQMATSTHTANGYIITALDCSFKAQSNAVSLIASTKTLIDRCAQHADCIPKTGSFCENVDEISSYMVNSTKPTVPNPFYERSDNVTCVLWQIN